MHVSLSTIKCHMMMEEQIVLGHLLLAAGIQVDHAKVEVILNFPTPKTRVTVRSFIGYDEYYRSSIEIFSKITFSLFQLLPNDEKFVWTEKCEQTFLRLNNCVTTSPLLRGPN